MDPTQNQQQITGYDPMTGAPIYGTPQPQVTGYDPATGAPIYGTPQPQVTGYDPVTGAPVYGTARVSNEVEDNKIFLIFSYLVCIVAVIAACMGVQKKGRYCAHHLRQALNVNIFWIGGLIVWGILSGILFAIIAAVAWRLFGIFAFISGLVYTVIGIGGLVLAIIGAVAAGNGTMNKVPLGNIFKFFPGA